MPVSQDAACAGVKSSPSCHLFREQQGLQLMEKVSLCFWSSHVWRFYSLGSRSRSPFPLTFSTLHMQLPREQNNHILPWCEVLGHDFLPSITKFQGAPGCLTIFLSPHTFD